MGDTLKNVVRDEPDRFLRYLSEEQKQLIKSAGNQEEAVERLRNAIKQSINPQDPRGSRFVEEEIFDDSEVMTHLYNAFFKEYRGTGTRPSPEVGVLKTEKKMEEELSLLEGIVFTIKQVPKAQRTRMGGYSRKKYAPTAPYERSTPRKFSEAELKMVWRNRMVKDNALIQKLHAASFPQRTKSSIATMKYRLLKKPPIFLSATKKM